MRAPATRRAEHSRRTREALLRAALRVVARHGFAGASVQRITAACGVAQGSLYTYFGSHRELLEELLPHEGIRLLRELGRSVDHGAGHFENERRTFEALFDYLRRKPYFLRLLTEAEIAAPQGYLQHAINIEERYLRTLHRARAAGEVRPLPDQDYRVIAGVLSSSRGYIGIGLCERDAKRLFHPPPIAPWVSDTYVRFVRRGLGCGQASGGPGPGGSVVAGGEIRANRGRGSAEGLEDAVGAIEGSESTRVSETRTSDTRVSDTRVSDTRTSDTRAEILDAAARRIHQDGYVGTSVAGICAEAGVAVGTFYGHFPSRHAMFDALIERARARMQAEVRAATAGSASACELEQRSFDAFFRHLLRNPWFTRIETEAAVWAPESYVRHFREIAAELVEALHGFRARGELQHFEERELPVLAWMLMTARHHLATRFVVAGGRVEPLAERVRSAWLDFAARGLENDSLQETGQRPCERSLQPPRPGDPGRPSPRGAPG